MTAYFGSAWFAADVLFAPMNSYLPGEDSVMKWLYRARAIIGVFMLVAIGARYHHPSRDLVAPFSPILGGVTKVTLLALAAVAPSTLAVVLFTHREKRTKAFKQMLLPIGSLFACGGLYLVYLEALALFHKILADGNSSVIILTWLLWICIGFWVLTFATRTIYLVTVGLCRLGDGHPLLPPIIGTGIAWTVAVLSLLNNNPNSNEPNTVTVLALLGGPVSITALSVAEILRLRKKYPLDFPFREGPFPVPPIPAFPEAAVHGATTDDQLPHEHVSTGTVNPGSSPGRSMFLAERRSWQSGSVRSVALLVMAAAVLAGVYLVTRGGSHRPPASTSSEATQTTKPGDYRINRQISATSPWTVTLTDIRVTASGQAEFVIKYANTGSTSAQLSCSSVTDPTIQTVTLSNGQTVAATATYCSQHPDQTAIDIGPGQSFMSYAVFSDASQLRRPFNLNWSASSLSGELADLQISD